MIGAWSSTHAVGVDIEDPTREVETVALARRFFSAAEAEVVEGSEGEDRLRVFYRFWTIKEAALKSIGEGLPYGLDAFRVELDSEPRISHSVPEYGRSVRFNAYQVDCGDCCAALVTRTPIS
jgi:4'-phosphopantetheinyl transferase